MWPSSTEQNLDRSIFLKNSRPVLITSGLHWVSSSTFWVSLVGDFTLYESMIKDESVRFLFGNPRESPTRVLVTSLHWVYDKARDTQTFFFHKGAVQPGDFYCIFLTCLAIFGLIWSTPSFMKSWIPILRGFWRYLCPFCTEIVGRNSPDSSSVWSAQTLISTGLTQSLSGDKC